MAFILGQKILDIIFLKKVRRNLRPKIAYLMHQNKLKRLKNAPKNVYSLKNLNCAIVHSGKEITDFKKQNQFIFDKYWQLDQQTMKSDVKEGTQRGWCCYCNKEVEFTWNVLPQFTPHIMLTERMICPECQNFNRVRALIHVLKTFDEKPSGKKIYCYEQTTPFYESLKKWLTPQNELIGSEYMGFDKKPGEIVNGIRHEDAMNMSFADNELDYILSNDVYEHVPDIDKTLKEAYRTLKAGGKLIFHIPFYVWREKTLKRAEIKDGEIIYLEEKEYHGGFSAEDPNGCLVYYNYGCDIFDIMKNAGFKNAYGVAIADENYVNIDYDPIVIFVGEK